MRRGKRLLAGFLSLLLILGGVWPAWAAEAEADLTGSIGLTVRFGLPQTRAAVDSRNLTLTLTGGGKTVELPLTGGEPARNDFNARWAVTAQNTEGVELTTERQIGYYQASLSGLPAGGSSYRLTVTGTGYVPYTADLTLDGYSRHVVIGTGSGTFSLGDVNGDGVVDEADQDAMSAQLGGSNPLYDLNGDGLVDVTDLSYINRMLGVTGQADTLETAAILRPVVDTSELTITGRVEDLFTPGGAVELAPAVPGGELKIPVDLGREVELREVVLTSPDGMGAVQAGAAVVDLADGTQLAVPFDTAAPEGVQAIGEDPGVREVRIDLGRKVAVKKVTIVVTRVAGQSGAAPEFAAVTEITFLKDIVPDNPQRDVSQANGLKADPGNGQVQLAWNPVQNVTGYIVSYGESRDALDQSLEVNTNRALVAGLENLTEYFFQVTAASDSWRGTPSSIISATPRPSSAPGAPSNIRVDSRSEALRVSWGKTKDATFYQLFFREAGTEAFQQFGSNTTATSAVITGLTNGTVYEVAVKAGNDKGVGPYSATAKGTPEQELIEMPNLPADGRLPGSIVASVTLTNPGNVDRSLCPSFTPQQLVDNDAATYWVAKSWWESSEITYTFTEPQDMNYLILVPYLGGGHKNAIKNYTITARDSEGNVLTTGSYRASQMTERNYLVLPFPAVTGVKSLSVSLAEWEGNGCRVSVSEMAFYRSESLPADIAALFADDAFTALAQGVGEAEIDALEERLDAKTDFYLDMELLRDELELARNLLAGGGALGTVRSGFQSRGSGDGQYGQSASDLQPLGVSVAVPDAVQAGTSARTALAVYAQLPEDAPVYLVPTQFFGESGIWKGGAIQLASGRNFLSLAQIGSLTDPRGGPLYLVYAGSHPEQIKLQVHGGENVRAVPLLELSGWYGQSEAQRREAISAYVAELSAHVSSLGTEGLSVNVFNTTEISTPSVLLSLPADQVLAGLGGAGGSAAAMAETLYQNVLAWEEELFVANKVQGIIDSGATLADYRYPMSTRQNIRYMRMFAGAFMYAAGNHVGVGFGSTTGLVCGKPVSATGQDKANGLFGWGIAHEIGHNMDKLGKAETTNNIYALAIQAWDGGAMTLPTRLTASNIWAKVYDKVSAGRPGAANNVFVQLAMYWQLHLAYDGAEEPLAFFNQFFRLWKAGEEKELSYDDRVAVLASRVAGRDLSEFFTRWGMTLSQEARSQMGNFQKEERALWYLSDASRTYRLDGGAAAEGSASVTASVSGSAVTLTLRHDQPEAILGYEILRDGKPVGFTVGDTYVDELGAANNLTYTYSAVPVDQLGNRGAEAAAGEIRVAWDKTIDPSLYTAVWEDGSLVITMRDGAVPVTGIQVTGLAEAAACTVQVKADAASETWTTARDGGIAEGVTYFNKPGAGPEDTRIWTYDAAVLRISGLPEGTGVALLDYPGDRVDFYQGASVGLLAEDYTYDDGQGGTETIPAGTLVILGTYRGDPVYNTVEIQGRYTTTAEGEHEDSTVERPMNGYGLLLAEIPADGQVSDTSDGFFLFVPDLEAEEALNAGSGVTDRYPFEIRAVFYRTDDPYGAQRPDGGVNRRETSRTLWLSFPEEDTLPQIRLSGGN